MIVEQIPHISHSLRCRKSMLEGKQPASQFGGNHLGPSGVECLSALLVVSGQGQTVKIGRKRSAFWWHKQLKAIFKKVLGKNLCVARLHLRMDNGVFLFVVAARFDVSAITEIVGNCCMLLNLRMWVKMLRVSACEEWGFFFFFASIFVLLLI